MRVVTVHGVGNYRPGEAIDAAAASMAASWEDHAASATPPAVIEATGAYYADLLHGPVAQGHLDLPDQIDSAIRAWVALLDPPRAVAMGRGTLPLRTLLSWAANQYGLDSTFVESFVARFFAELERYFDEDHRQTRFDCQQRVVNAIRSSGSRVVIAHSLGSVVSYEALWANSDLDVDLWVTLGSPLAMPGLVIDRLWSPTLCRPPTVRRWVNVSDVGDLVAIPRKAIGTRFKDVDKDLELTIHSFDFHLAKHYLRSALVAGLFGRA